MGLVYFMRRADGVGPIKIGHSKLPAQRLQAMQAWSPEILTIVASAPGTFLDERRLHRQFEKYRLHGEWFEPVAIVLAAMTKVATTGILPNLPSDDQHIVIAKMYRQGSTLQEIGVEFGITRERVRQILRKIGVPSLGLRARESTININKRSIEMALAGATLKDIADELGVTTSCISGVLKKNGITALRAKHPRHEGKMRLAMQIANDYQSGMSMADITAKYELRHSPMVHRYLKIAGVKPNRVIKVSDIQINLNDVARDFNAGMSFKEMASKHGVSMAALKQFVSRAGLDTSRQALEARRVQSVIAANKKRVA